MLAKRGGLVFTAAMAGAFKFDLESYLERIGLGDLPTADATGLGELHQAHVFSVPFENLDIMLGRGISLEPAALFDKLVTRRRGGYCFEQNGFFLMALEAMGFEVRPLLARVLLDPGKPTARTHQVLLVEMAGSQWLADVGFGAGTLGRAIPMEPDNIEVIHGAGYRIILKEPFGATLQRRETGDWYDQYSFSLERVLPADIEMSNYYTSTSPEVHFTRRRITMLAHPRGRTDLTDMELILTRGGQKETRTLSGGVEYTAALKEHFAIELDAGFDEFK